MVSSTSSPVCPQLYSCPAGSVPTGPVPPPDLTTIRGDQGHCAAWQAMFAAWALTALGGHRTSRERRGHPVRFARVVHLWKKGTALDARKPAFPRGAAVSPPARGSNTPCRQPATCSRSRRHRRRRGCRSELARPPPGGRAIRGGKAQSMGLITSD